MATQFIEARSSSQFETFLAQHLERDLLRFTTAGSVDDGKSTLIGRLLYDSNAIYDDQLQSIQQGRLNRSTGPIDFSLLTDGLRVEREQGITIDVAYRYFTTPRRKFIIADTPGHEQYTGNMATGASTADAAVVLFDARKGILPQSRRHAYIAALLGIPNIIAAINKMDLVGYSEEVFETLQRDLEELARQMGLTRPMHCIPISALEGDNVVVRSTNTPWYAGPCLLEHLEEIPIAQANTLGAFRFPIQYVIRPGDGFRGFAGQVTGGSVAPGDAVVALPSQRRTRVRSVITFDGALAQAVTGSSVTLQLEDELDLSRGHLLVSEEHPPRVSRSFAANIVWLHATSLDASKTWVLRHGTDELRVHVRAVRNRIDVHTMETIPATCLEWNDIGVVELEATRELWFDLYSENRRSGSFILIDLLTNATVGAGMITQDLAPPQQPATRVPAAARSRRSGHQPAAIWLGTSHSLAAALERALLAAGHRVIVLDDEQSPVEWSGELVRGLYSAGLISLYTTAQIRGEKKRQLYDALPADRILDADRLDHEGGEASVVQQVLGWLENLQPPAGEESR